MLFFSMALKRHQLVFTKLSEYPQFLPIAAQWAEDEWGYIRNKGVDYRMEVLSSISHETYIGTFCGQPVAMFALLNQPAEISDEKFKPFDSCELRYVYVDKNYRSLGFGSQILKEAKRCARLSEVDTIILDTLKPSLNGFYKKEGAVVVCEGSLVSHPTDVLRMST